jgi:predicted acetyltransferase
MFIKISNIKKKDNKIFLKFATIYFKGLNNKFKSTKSWKRNYLKDLLKNKRILAKWISENKNKVGFLIIKKLKNKNSKKTKFIIHDFFILREFRSKKIGTSVVNQIIKYCKNKKITEIEIEIIEKNKKVINFWKNFKFKLKSKKFCINT